MTADAAMLDQPDNVRGAFTQSVAFHVAIIGGLTLYAYLHRSVILGDPDAGAKAVGVTAVDKIPVPTRGPKNPVANDSNSELPQEIAKPTPKEAREPEPEKAEALLPPDRKQPLVPKARLKSFTDIEKNQLTSRSPQAASSPLFSPPAGSNLINSGDNGALGTRFGAYAARIKELTTQNWHREDIDSSVANAPPVTIRFDILRDGRATNVQLIRRSNISTLDLSVQNAILARYPALPAEYEGGSVTITYTFEYKR